MKFHLDFKFSAFSLIEITISLIIIFTILAATIPLISKRLQGGAQKVEKYGSSENCTINGSVNEFCKFCDNEAGVCIVCTLLCADGQDLNVEECKCE